MLKFLHSSKLSTFLFNRQKYVNLGIRYNTTSLWIQPDGYDTGIMIYNSASRSKVPLKTLKQGQLTWYMCGPTVYDSAHIGHAICYIRFDIIRRILVSCFNLNVVQVMGITDIDDKIINKSLQQNVDFKEITKKYEAEFFSDMDKLRVLKPTHSLRVSDNVQNIVKYITKIIDNGYGYAVSDGSVYFDTKAFTRRGKLKKTNMVNAGSLQPGSLKRIPSDFALWKGTIKTGEPSWNSPWGKPGRPGWHIECSAIASSIFGDKLDLHSGGIDLLFPHHENEEAQCCAHDKSLQWCSYWIHAGHLHFKDRKMSKSLKNTISVNYILQNYSANIFRLFCLEKSYKSDVEYDPSTSLTKATNRLNSINSFFHCVEACLFHQLECCITQEEVLIQKLSDAEMSIKAALADNFDYTRAINIIMNLVDFFNDQFHKRNNVNNEPTENEVLRNLCSYIYSILNTFGIQINLKKNIVADTRNYCNEMQKMEPIIMEFQRKIKEYYERKDYDDNTLEILTNANKSFDNYLFENKVNFKDLNSNEAFVSGSQFIQITDQLIELRGIIRNFALLRNQKDSYVNLSKSEKKNLRQERQALMKACDFLRNSLIKEGFMIMDHANCSTWSFTGVL